MLAEKMCQQMNSLLVQPPLDSSSFGVLAGSWVGLTMLAILVSLFGVALVYIFASFLRNQQVLAWTKAEFFQIFATAIIAAFVVFLVAGMCSFDVSFLDPARYAPVPAGGTTNMYQIVDSYFGTVEGFAYMVYASIMYVTRIMSFLGRVTMLSNPLGVGSVENPLESVGQINSLIFYMLSGYVVSYLLIHLQQRMLDYLAISCLFYLFPFGVFFRAFEPTRKFGGTLIGISIAMFFFYPMILVFNDHIVFSSVNNAVQDMTGASGMLTVAEKSIQNNELPMNDPNKVSETMGTELSSQSGFEKFVVGIGGAPIALMRFVMIYFVAAGVLPLINFIVLVSITRTLTQMLGEEVDVSNLTRLI
ncbi:Uncharacterised protein [uncultured archaeon]|nr:Uncharacterised protein [uncultured archaeon]